MLAVGVAETSVPVVSKIFADLKILHTQFARLVLGVAVLEDIVSWLALAIATATAGRAALHPGAMSYHLLLTVANFILGPTIIPRMIKLVNKARFNVLARYSPTGYAISVLLAYSVVAGALDITAWYSQLFLLDSLSSIRSTAFAEGLEAIVRVSFAFFIPVYFAIASRLVLRLRVGSMSLRRGSKESVERLCNVDQFLPPQVVDHCPLGLSDALEMNCALWNSNSVLARNPDRAGGGFRGGGIHHD